jgi:dTMP kinase
MRQKGKFITLEGTEGAGKSTNLQFICEWLDGAGISYCVTREPGGTEIAEQIRALLLAHHNEPLNAMAELLLIFAGRAQHIDQVIEPALAAGKWVVCDRFTDATYAYQGAGRGLGEHYIAKLEDLVQGSLRPDKTLIFDVSTEIGMQRASDRGALDRFESEPVAFFDRVRSAYHQRCAADPKRYELIDASRSLPEVQESVLQVLTTLCQQQGL